MSNQYLILIDKRDEEKFRRFKISQFNSDTKQFLAQHNLEHIWGFHQSQIKNSDWSKLEPNDYVLFTIPKNNFRLAAQVAKKIVDEKLGKSIWPDNLNSKEITHFLLFKTIQEIDLSYVQTVERSDRKLDLIFPGLYVLKNNLEIITTTNTSKPKPSVMPILQNGPAQKELFEVNRFLRDSKKVKKLKNLYSNKCQICNFTFEYNPNQFYSEVHHYDPLKACGDDDIDNMIVVCPNHHAQFDHNVIAIDRDGTSIIDKSGRQIAIISFHEDHKLNSKNIESQLEL